MIEYVGGTSPACQNAPRLFIRLLVYSSRNDSRTFKCVTTITEIGSEMRID